MAIIWRAIADSHKEHFRVVHFNVLRNHLHFLVEATDQVALSRGMQGLGVRLARRLNNHLGRRGRLLAERYHERQLRTPRETRNAIRYVLQNRRHHAAQQGIELPPRWIDWRSSAPWFDGWRWAVPTGDRHVRRLRRTRPPTLPARTWLLAVGWLRYGPLEFDEAPAV
jgi:REP element-mobilizing transposase RayT